MTNLLVFPVLIASLAGSLHCVGMCGPFMALAGGLGQTGKARLRSVIYYHSGRLITYLTLGGIAGALGSALDLAGATLGVAQISALVAGLALLFWGLASFLRRPRPIRLLRRAPNRLQASLSRILSTLEGKPPATRGLILGLSTTLIPCGWLYAFLAMAAGSGGVRSAIAILFFFWVGSLPVLFGLSFGLQALLARLGSRARAVSSALIAGSGLLLILLRVTTPVAPQAAIAPASIVPAVGATDCPLHRGSRP